MSPRAQCLRICTDKWNRFDSYFTNLKKIESGCVLKKEIKREMYVAQLQMLSFLISNFDLERFKFKMAAV